MNENTFTGASSRPMARPKMLPHNLEAEQSVLGCMLIDEETPVVIMNELKENHFYTDVHKIIFEAMYNIYSVNSPIDFVTLTDELNRVGKLDSVGGLDYITLLTNIVPSSANFMHYVDIVKRDYTLRELINISSQIIEKAYNNDSHEETLNFAEKSIFDLAQKGSVSALDPVGNTVDDVLAKFELIQRDKSVLRGITTGFYALDKITNGLQRSDLILVAARPGIGKTSFSMNIVTNAALQGHRCAIFSLEMPRSQIVQRCLCSIANVSMKKALSGDMNAEEWQRILKAGEKLKSIEIFADDNSLNNPMDILRKCRRLKREKKGLDLIMIDYLQLMSSPRPKDSRQLEISEFTRALKIAAKELDVPIILLSQLNRAIESRKDHTPILADLRESGSIEQDADIVMFINRPDSYADYKGDKDICEIIIAKHRNGEQGKVNLAWHGETTTFKNLDKDANAESLQNSAPPPPPPPKRKGQKEEPMLSSVEDEEDVF